MPARSGAHASGDDARNPFELWLTCPDCGDVVVPAQSVDVYLDLSHDRHLVAYRCPRCRRRGACPLDDDDVAWLMQRGHAVRVLTVAAELHEPRPGGPPFQWDDILAFHEMLSDSGPTRLP